MNELLKRSSLFVKRNASTILTCIGGAGVITTSVMAVKATPKALTLLDEAEKEKGEELTTWDRVVIAGPAYIPAVVSGVATIACVFGANMLNKHQQAALTSAYVLLDSSYKEYKNKVEELYGEGADTEVRNEIAKDHYKETNISVSDNKQLFYDEFSGRYFEATAERVLRAEHEINRIVARDCGAFLNEFYELLGLEIVDYGDYLGWSLAEITEMQWYCWVEFEHRKIVMDDGLECMIITMLTEPTFDFENY